jgi:hypothetical protein
MAEFTLREANQTGWLATASWRLPDGSVVEATFTHEEYLAWAARGTGEPPRPDIMAPDAVWTGVAAGFVPVLDTPSGRIEEGVVLRTMLPVVQDGLTPLADTVVYRSARNAGAWDVVSVRGDDIATVSRELEPGIRLEGGKLVKDDVRRR